MRGRRGILIPCLLLLALMLVMCLGQMSRQPYQYRVAKASAAMAQARALAEAGLEDFRVKWSQDLDFPVTPPDGTRLFSYMNEILDFETSQLRGYYRITVDASWNEAPYKIYRVTSEGHAGEAEDPNGIYTIQATLDVATDARPSGPVRVGQWIEWKELVP